MKKKKPVAISIHAWRNLYPDLQGLIHFLVSFCSLLKILKKILHFIKVCTILAFLVISIVL